MTMIKQDAESMKADLSVVRSAMIGFRNTETVVASRTALGRFVDQLDDMIAWTDHAEVERELRDIEARRAVLLAKKARIDRATAENVSGRNVAEVASTHDTHRFEESPVNQRCVDCDHPKLAAWHVS